MDIDIWVERYVGDIARILDCDDEDLAVLLRRCATWEPDTEPDDIAAARLAQAALQVACLVEAKPGHTGRIERLLAAYDYTATAGTF